jgi:DNA-binding response OmpR family regulator
MSVLIIEDNRTVAENIRRCLEVERCGATIAPDGEEGARLALVNEYDCIILDLNLPRMDGMAVCALLRQEGRNTPILMLTARAGKRAIIAVSIAAPTTTSSNPSTWKSSWLACAP